MERPIVHLRSFGSASLANRTTNNRILPPTWNRTVSWCAMLATCNCSLVVRKYRKSMETRMKYEFHIIWKLFANRNPSQSQHCTRIDNNNNRNTLSEYLYSKVTDTHDFAADTRAIWESNLASCKRRSSAQSSSHISRGSWVLRGYESGNEAMKMLNLGNIEFFFSRRSALFKPVSATHRKKVQAKLFFLSLFSPLLLAESEEVFDSQRPERQVAKIRVDSLPNCGLSWTANPWSRGSSRPVSFVSGAVYASLWRRENGNKNSKPQLKISNLKFKIWLQNGGDTFE